MKEEIGVDHVDRWKNRRIMAWASLIAGLAFPALLLFTKSTALGDIAFPFYSFVGMVVSAYILGAVVDDKWQLNGNNRRNRNGHRNNQYNDMNYYQNSNDTWQPPNVRY